MKLHFINNHYVLASTDRRKILDARTAINNGIKAYGFVSVADVCDLCGTASITYSNNKRGWMEYISIAAVKGTMLSDQTDIIDWTLDLPVALYDNRGSKVLRRSGRYPWGMNHDPYKFKEALPKASKDAKIQKVYNVLTKIYCKHGATMRDIGAAMEEAIGYLGEVLE